MGQDDFYATDEDLIVGDAPLKELSDELIKTTRLNAKKQDACESLKKLVQSVVFVFTQRIFEKIQDEKIDRDSATKLVQAVLGAGIEVVGEFEERTPEIVDNAMENDDDED